MESVGDGQSNLQPVQSHHSARAWLRQLSSRELMDALMAADMPMGGTNEQRIERLLSVMQPQELAQFLPRAVLQRAPATVSLPIE